MSVKIYWDEVIGDDPSVPDWIDAAVNYLGANEAPQAGDALETPADEGVIVLVAANPFNERDTCRITLVSGEDEDGHPSMVVSRIA